MQAAVTLLIAHFSRHTTETFSSLSILAFRAFAQQLQFRWKKVTQKQSGCLATESRVFESRTGKHGHLHTLPLSLSSDPCKGQQLTHPCRSRKPLLSSASDQILSSYSESNRALDTHSMEDRFMVPHST
jgi:hypothetical protein